MPFQQTVRISVLNLEILAIALSSSMQIQMLEPSLNLLTNRSPLGTLETAPRSSQKKHESNFSWVSCPHSGDFSLNSKEFHDLLLKSTGEDHRAG
jgi:hypothetical protein